MLCNANLHLKVSWLLKITPICLADLVGVIVDDPSLIVKLCCNNGVAMKTRSMSVCVCVRNN